MKKMRYLYVFVVIYTTFMILFGGCGSTSSTSNGAFDRVDMKDYYSKEDFDSIVIGESVFQDVYNIAPPESLQVTSYGGLCKYPMQSGGYIWIKFLGKELVVGAIEEDSLSVESG